MAIPRTVNDVFAAAAARDLPRCLYRKLGGTFQPISTAELVTDVRRVAAALVDFGVGPGDRVALMADNGPHWPTIDFATLGIGAVLVPIYPTLTASQAAYIAADCGARVVFVQEAERLDGLLDERATMPDAETFVQIGGETADGAAGYRSLLDSTTPMPADEFESRGRSVGPDDLATFIYTSGTTGQPKGVMLSHGNVASNVAASAAAIDASEGMTALSFLPLSHSFERLVDYLYFYRGVAIAYAESVQTVARDFGEVGPDMFVSVPRIYEKILATVRERAASASAIKRRMLRWAESVGREALPYRLRLEKPPGGLGLRLALADRLVFSKLRALFGERFQFAVSGGAPLPRDVAEFFWAAGIEIYEGYGLTETSPVLSVNRRGAARVGTVGTALDGVELEIADDGEIVARGPNIMQGYYGMPEATAEVIDGDGWFKTGDVGELDDDGYLSITDRKKEILVNAYGKNIAPAPIEGALKSSRFIEQAMLIGDRRKFLSALLVPDFQALEGWAKKRGLEGSRDRILAHPDVQDLYRRELESVNATLARYEQARAFRLAPEEFTIEGGEITPTLKVKRKAVSEKYSSLIEEMYDEADDD